MTNEEMIERATAWWTEVRESPGRAAELRRCTSVREAVLLPQTLSLIRRLGGGNGRAERIAALAVVLAHVKESDSRLLMRAAGDSWFEAEDATLSRSRFQQMIAAREPDELLLNATRLVALLDRRANVGDLVLSLVWWNDRTRAAWATTYYAADINEDAKKDSANG